MIEFEKAMQAFETLLQFNRKITMYCLEHELPSENEIQEARAAAAFMTETGHYQFSADSTDAEFFREVKNFSNSWR